MDPLVSIPISRRQRRSDEMLNSGNVIDPHEQDDDFPGLHKGRAVPSLFVSKSRALVAPRIVQLWRRILRRVLR